DQLHPSRLPRRELRGFEWHDVSYAVCGAQVHVHRRPRPQWTTGLRQQLEPHIDAERWRKCPGVGEPVSARERVLVETYEVECTALARVRGMGRALLSVEAAYPRRLLRRHHRHRVALPHAAREYGAGRHGTVTCEGEDAVDGQAEQAFLRAR